MNKEGWYVAEGEQPEGPFSLDALKRRIWVGKLTRANLVYHSDSGWSEARDIPELEKVFKEVLKSSSPENSQKDTTLVMGPDQHIYENPVVRKTFLPVIGAVLFIFIVMFVFQRIIISSAKRVIEPRESEVTESSKAGPKKVYKKAAVSKPKSPKKSIKKKKTWSGSNVSEKAPADPWDKIDDDRFIAKLKLRKAKAGSAGKAISQSKFSGDDKLYLSGIRSYNGGRMEGALADFAKLSRPKKYPELVLYLGMANWKLSNPKQATENLKKYLKEHPHDFEANMGFISSMKKLGRRAKLKDYYARGIAKAPESHISNYLCGIMTGDVVEAIGYLRRSIDLKKDFGPAYIKLLPHLILVREYAQAEEVVEELRSYKPAGTEAEILLLHASLLCETERFTEAVKLSRSLIAGHNTAEYKELHDQVVLIAAEALLNSNRLDEAEKYIRQASLQKTTDTTAWLKLKLLQNKLARIEGDFEIATKILVEAEPKAEGAGVLSRKITLELGFTYLEAEDTGNAISCFDRVIKDKNNISAYVITAYLWKGVALNSRGDQAGAGKAWKAAAERFPSEKNLSVLESACIEYLTGRVGFDKIRGRFEKETTLRQALISFCVGLKEQMDGNLYSARANYSSAFSYLKQRKNFPYYMVRRGKSKIEKSLIVPD